MNESRYREAEREFWRGFECTPNERFVRLPRLGVRVRVQEVGAGEPVLFIHGGPNSGSTWAPLVARFGGFRCLLVDRPGTGLSEQYAVTAENLAEFGARFVGDVLDGMGVDRAHVVGSSFGGHLALRSAAAESERFGVMVQMACPALAPGERPPPFLRLLTSAAVRRVLAALPPTPRANRMIMRQLGHGRSLDAGRMPASFLDWYLELQRHTDTNRNDGEMIGSVLPERERLTLSDELLGAVRVNTLFIWGEDDTFGSMDVGRYMVARMPDAALESVPAAGHLPWLDDPEGVARAVVGFFARHTMGEAAARS
jgi:2-hydroxy-6-oxonona-2,4-dienedioate hydrolase